MDTAEFITVEHTSTDLILSFAIAPRAERSLILQRSPRYEVLLPADERGILISMVPEDDDIERNLLLSAAWESSRVEFRSELRIYVIDISKVDKREVVAGQKLLRRMAKGVSVDVRIA